VTASVGKHVTTSVSAPSFKGLRAASRASSKAMRGNRKKGTQPEVILLRALRSVGLKVEACVAGLPGIPDIVLRSSRVVVFCDGDFWHGRNWTVLRQRLSRRANARYWLAKIAYNTERDIRQRRALRKLGWRVLRFWESDILKSPQRVARRIHSVVRKRMGKPKSP